MSEEFWPNGIGCRKFFTPRNNASYRRNTGMSSTQRYSNMSSAEMNGSDDWHDTSDDYDDYYD